MSSRVDFKDDVEAFEDALYCQCMQSAREGGIEYPDYNMKELNKKNREIMFSIIEWSEKVDLSSRRKTETSEELRNMIDNLESNRAGPIVFTRKMEKIRKQYNAYMLDEAKAVLNEATGGNVKQIIDNCDKIALRDSNDDALKDTFCLENWLNTEYEEETYSDEEKEHLFEVADELASVFSHLCDAETAGKRHKINAKDVERRLKPIESWLTSRKGKAISVRLSRLIALKVIKILAKRKHFYCMDCRETSFNILQYLAHLASGLHRKHVATLVVKDQEGTALLYAQAHNYLLLLSTICDDVHTSFVKQYLTPLVECGGRKLTADCDQIPVLVQYKKMREKYDPHLDVQANSSIDAAYLATIQEKIVDMHTETMPGKELYKEINEYLGIGEAKEKMTRKEREMEAMRAKLEPNFDRTNIFFHCKICGSVCGSRELFYTHLMNPLHLVAWDRTPDRSMDLFTISINLHGPRPSLAPAYTPEVPAPPVYSGDDVEIIGEVPTEVRLFHSTLYKIPSAPKPGVRSKTVKDSSGETINRNIRQAWGERGAVLFEKYPSDEKERRIIKDFASTYVDALMARRQADKKRLLLKGRQPIGIEKLSEKDLARRTLPEQYVAPFERRQFIDPRYEGNVNIFNDLCDDEDADVKGPVFIKMNENKLPEKVVNSALTFCCSCIGDCAENSECECRTLSTANVTLLDDGRVVIKADDYFKTHLYTCGSLCSCNVQECKNRLVYEEKEYELEVVMRNREMGFEVRALRQYSQGEVVIEFFGNVEANVEAGEEEDFSFLVYDGCNGSERKFMKKGDFKCLPDKIFINPFHSGGMARFVGHSRLNNVYPLRVYSSGTPIGMPRLVFICSLSIPPGDFVKVNYGQAYHRTIAECGCSPDERCDCVNQCLCDEKLCHNLHVLCTIRNEDDALSVMRRREVENRVRIGKMEKDIIHRLHGEEQGIPVIPYPRRERWEIVPSRGEKQRKEEKDAKKKEERERKKKAAEEKKKNEKNRRVNDEEEDGEETNSQKKKKRSVTNSKVDGPKNKKSKSGKK